MKPLAILALIAAALLWIVTRHTEDAIDNGLLRAARARRNGKPLSAYRLLEAEPDQGWRDLEEVDCV